MVINDRFEADALRNELTDKQTGKVHRLEPRLMKLLCLLAENEGVAVSRKTIIKEVWNDYPGGDQGLNQAVSVLRKLLRDYEKKIIETLPKTGYCFHGTISADQIAPKQKELKLAYLSAAAFLLLIIALISVYYNNRADHKPPAAKLTHEESVRDFKIDSKRKLDSKEKVNALKMDSLGKLDSKGY